MLILYELNIVVLETPAEDFGWEITRPQGALSEIVPPLAIMKANEEVSKMCEQPQDAYVRACSMWHTPSSYRYT